MSLEADLQRLSQADDVLAKVIAAIDHGDLDRIPDGRPSDNYGTLVRAIVGQQLSTKAAHAIFTRLTERFDGRAPSPEQILAQDAEELRLAVGLSRAKALYLRSLAEHVISGELELDRLGELADDDVMAELVAVKGLGPWSAQMFLIFHLARPDILPVGDLGIRRAIERWWKLHELPDAATIEAIAEPWRPLRSLACRCLWRSLNNAPA